MANVTLTTGQSGNTGALAADTLFYVASGTVELSTDGGTTYIPWSEGQGDKISSGKTVNYRNTRRRTAELRYMSV